MAGRIVSHIVWSLHDGYDNLRRSPLLESQVMPELPEVETVCRGLEPELTGRMLTGVTLRRSNLRYPLPDGFVAKLTSRRVIAVRRRAKFILVQLDNEITLVIHLGMSGRLVIHTESPPPPPGPHDHVDVVTAEPGEHAAACFFLIEEPAFRLAEFRLGRQHAHLDRHQRANQILSDKCANIPYEGMIAVLIAGPQDQIAAFRRLDQRRNLSCRGGDRFLPHQMDSRLQEAIEDGRFQIAAHRGDGEKQIVAGEQLIEIAEQTIDFVRFVGTQGGHGVIIVTPDVDAVDFGQDLQRPQVGVEMRLTGPQECCVHLRVVPLISLAG